MLTKSSDLLVTNGQDFCLLVLELACHMCVDDSLKKPNLTSIFAATPAFSKYS